VFKEQFDSIKKIRVRTKEQSDSLIDKLNLKSAENEDLKAQIQDKGIFEQDKAKQPLDKELNFSSKHALRIQELLVYVQDTCPNVIKLNEKKVVVTPKNKVKKVRTIDTTIDQQVAMDEALVPHAQRLRIGRSNLCLLSDIKSKESTLKLVYDVVPATVHHHAIRFKMDNKKHIVNLESFRDMLYICPRVHGQSFVEPSFKEEILAFIHFLGHSAAIRTLTDVNINKLYQPWRSFAAIINKCLTGKSSGYDSLRLSQAQILNSNAYKENYAVATGVTPPKPKAGVQKTRSSFETIVTPPTTAAGLRLTTSTKGKQVAKATKAKSLSTLFEVAMTKGQLLKLATKRSLQKTHVSQNSTDDEVDDDEGKDGDGDEEEGNGEEDLGLNVGGEESHVEEEEEDELYKDVNINQGRGIQATLEVEDSHVTLTLVNRDGQKQSSSVSSQFVTSMLNLTLDVGMESILETTSQRYMDQRMNEAVQVAVQIQSDCLCDEAQRENDEFLKTVDENVKKIINDQVKEQVKTSYAVAVDLSEMELKKILIEKMEGNKSIQRSDEQRNLYKALVEAYESDKIILDTYRETATLKRRHNDDADKDEEPSARPDRGSKRRKEGKEPESASALKKKVTRSAGKSTQGSKSRQASVSGFALAERKSDKEKEAAMIQAIDKRPKTRRITRNIERFVGGRLYEGDFRMLQSTI
nr:hypothetical protein [Tanacetum cinerariifolium]